MNNSDYKLVDKFGKEADISILPKPKKGEVLVITSESNLFISSKKAFANDAIESLGVRTVIFLRKGIKPNYWQARNLIERLIESGLVPIKEIKKIIKAQEKK